MAEDKPSYTVSNPTPTREQYALTGRRVREKNVYYKSETFNLTIEDVSVCRITWNDGEVEDCLEFLLESDDGERHWYDEEDVEFEPLK